MKLIVTQAFGSYAQGDTITDAAKIDGIMKSEQKIYVMQVADAQPAPQVPPTPSK